MPQAHISVGAGMKKVFAKSSCSKRPLSRLLHWKLGVGQAQLVTVHAIAIVYVNT